MNQLAEGEGVPMESVRWTLTKIWFGGSAVMVVLILIHTIIGKYGTIDEAAKVWGWLFGLVVPSIGLIVSVWGATAQSVVSTLINRKFYRLVVWLSLGYFLIMVLSYVALSMVVLETSAGPVGSDEVAEAGEHDVELRPAEQITTSMVWLGPLQGVVVAAMGYAFFSQHGGTPAPSPSPSPSEGDQGSES